MEFENLEYSETGEIHSSGKESEIEIVFIPGPFNPEIWRNQVRYFSNRFNVKTYRVKGGYTEEVSLLEKVLERSDKRKVLVSSGPGNALAQLYEERDDVIATVLTNVSAEYSFPKMMYNLVSRYGFRKPKIAKELFFGPKANYENVKSLVEDLVMPEYGDFASYIEGFGLREPIKDSLFLQVKNDRFSSLEYARKIRANAGLSVMESGGSFPFYMKPEEYNKAVFDFLLKVESFAESKTVREKREVNRTLNDNFAKKVEETKVRYR